MRGLALLVACSGCLISEPEGALQSWPPTLGGTVEAVVAGDLDANGSTDVVVMMSGKENQAGLYLLESDIDLMWETGDPVKSFSEFVPMIDLVHPAAAFIEGGAAPRIYIASGTDTLTISSFANNLEFIEYNFTTVAGAGAAWARMIDFPGDMPHVAVSNGSTIEHLLADGLEDPRPLPAPMSPTWNLAQVATSYVDGTNQIAVVATADAIYRCVIPTTPGAMFMWEVVRMGTGTWVGQTAYDFNGDGREEILGLDVQAHKVCVVDPGASVIPVATPSCIPLGSPFTGTDVTIFAGTNLTMNPGLDILVAQANGNETSYSLAEEVTYIPATMTLMGEMVRTLPVSGPPRGHSVLATPSPGRPASLLTFGTDGTAVCILGPC